jgi:hypothetical protein|tara:strand:+ start:443 stop:622 length:180 start_codon:yes stop_codon:yes gene_type:complete
MPKKKLTKKQTQTKLIAIGKNIALLMDDKLNHMESRVPMSLNKMIELRSAFFNAFKRVK